MVSFFAGIFATIITIPFIGFLLVFIISILALKNKRKSLFVSVDITTFFLIIAVHYLLLIIVGKSLFWLIFLILVLTVGLFAFLNWKFTKEMNMSKILKGFWRFTFLLFFVAYFILFITGMIQRVQLVT